MFRKNLVAALCVGFMALAAAASTQADAAVLYQLSGNGYGFEYTADDFIQHKSIQPSELDSCSTNCMEVYFDQWEEFDRIIMVINYGNPVLPFITPSYYFDDMAFSTFGTHLANSTGYSGQLTVSRLETPGAVPEPTTWVLMMGGFGLLGAELRRRRTMAGAAIPDAAAA